MTKSLIKPITAPKIIPKIVVPPAKIQPAEVPKPEAKLVPSKVSVYLQVIEAPAKLGLGQAFLMDARRTGIGRAIGLTLFKERLLISRALSKGDQLTIRFAASLILAEFLVYSRASNLREINLINRALIQQLGGPWPFSDNLTFITCELCRNEITSLDKLGLFEAKPTSNPWMVLENVPLYEVSPLWQWNLAAEKPVKKEKKSTGETK
jgi:hypothetical protein